MGTEKGKYLTELRRSSAASPVDRELSRSQQKRIAIEEELDLGEEMSNPKSHELGQNSSNRVSCSECSWKRSFDRVLDSVQLSRLQKEHQRAIKEENDNDRRRQNAKDSLY